MTDTGGLSSTNSLGIDVTEPATTLTFSPTEDARVEKNHPIDNYGDLGQAPICGERVRELPALPGVRHRGRDPEREAAPHGLDERHGRRPRRSLRDRRLVRVDADLGDEARRAAPTRSPTPARSPRAPKVEWDVTSLVDGDGQLDLALASTSTDGVEFLSKEATNAAKRPVLEVTFATPFDGQAPTAPADLTAEAAGSNIDLAWTAATDNVGGDQLRDLPQTASCSP